MVATFTGKPFLSEIRKAGFEPDQLIVEAVRNNIGSMIHDWRLFLALYQLNTISARFLKLDIVAILKVFSGIDEDVSLAKQPHPDPETVLCSRGNILRDVMLRAISYAKGQNTLGVRHFLRAVIEMGFDSGDNYSDRPTIIDLLSFSYTGKLDTQLSEIPEVNDFLKVLIQLEDGAEDFQYIITKEEGKIKFRITSILDDYVQHGQSGILVPQRAIISHNEFGTFTLDEIEELEDMLNNQKATEADYQIFFEKHTHFLRNWDLREVYPHVYLTREQESSLIPDFIITNQETQDAAIVELKKPTHKIVRHQNNRTRFADAVMEAKTQLLEYCDWFEIPQNRTKLKAKFKMEIYRPRLMVIIGRASEFRDGIDRQKLRSRDPKIEVVTYDDILTLAKQRQENIRKYYDSNIVAKYPR
ncbi:MAG: Shedu anti-phage system protein SduA domain-containing protein [Desulfomonilia bacterium]